MNWSIETEGNPFEAEVVHAYGEHETESTEVSPSLLEAVRAAATTIAAELGGDEIHATIQGHETTDGDGFRPAHVQVTVSRLDPTRAKPELEPEDGENDVEEASTEA